MNLTPENLRGVQFRQARRGYDPAQVDAFLEQTAQRVAELQQPRGEIETVAVKALPPGSVRVIDPPDEATLQRTLVLAQRTADLAIQEAQDQATIILAKAQRDADDLAVKAQREAQAIRTSTLRDAQAELAKVQATQAAVQARVDLLGRWVDEHRVHLAKTLEAAQVMFSDSALDPPALSAEVPANVPPVVLDPGLQRR